MARNRYVKDYRLLEQIDEKGRIRTTYEYIGDDYFYTAEATAVRRTKRKYVLLLILGWAFFLGALLPVSGGMHIFYISFPLIFSAIPWGILVDTALSVFPRKEPLEHRHADRLANRLPPAALAAAILPAVALVGEAVSLLLGRIQPLPGDFILLVCAAGMIAAALRLFSLRKGLETGTH